MNTDNKGDLIGYFGFGSLVNRHTLQTDYVSIIPATLKGWSRHWQAHENDAGRDVALLSVHRDPESEIKGALVTDFRSSLPEVDIREYGYTRTSLQKEAFLVDDPSKLPDELFVYVADGEDRAEHLPLLQSYLDAVLQGFHELYGVAGIEHFVSSTKSFRRNLVKDRDNPLYPRAVKLTDEQRVLAYQAVLGVTLRD